MEKFNNLNEWDPKKLRSLRNNLNNRLSSYKLSGVKTKPLAKGHKLFGLSEDECKNLLKTSLKIMKPKKNI